MIPFITKRINSPWTDADIRRYQEEGSQRDKIVYNGYYNSRLILTEENIFLCSMKLVNGMFKNFYLVAVTRNLFYFIAFIPEAICLQELRDNEFIRKMFTRLSLHKAFADSITGDVQLNNCATIADCCAIMVRVNANIGEFLFPKRQKIDNMEIRNKFTIINNLHSRFLKERDVLIKAIKAYEEKTNERNEQLKRKVTKIVIRKVAICTVTTILGIPPVPDLDILLGLDDLSTLADVGDISSSILDMVDVSDNLMA
jgi:hypothetical protein